MSRDAILLHAAGMGAGEHDRILCPACGGGRTRERSLSISIDELGKPVWHCFRANCGESGGERGARSLVRTNPLRKPTKVKPYTGTLACIDKEDEQFLLEKVGWTEPHLDIARPMVAVDESRFAFPIFSPMGLRRGYVLRRWSGDPKYKALTRMDVEEPHTSWYRVSHNRTVVVVEDIPSAVRVALYMPCIALCGSGASTTYAAEIAAHYTSVVWALDADATAQALRQRRQHSLMFEQSRVLVLPKDFKDMKEDELVEHLNTIKDGDGGQ